MKRAIPELSRKDQRNRILCWAVHNTILSIAEGFVDGFPTDDEIIDYEEDDPILLPEDKIGSEYRVMVANHIRDVRKTHGEQLREEVTRNRKNMARRPRDVRSILTRPYASFTRKG